MSFDPYAELGIPRFVPTPALPKKVKSQVVAEKKAEVKKKVIVKRAKEKVKKVVLARKLKGGRRTKREMSEARGMGMEDKIVKDTRRSPSHPAFHAQRQRTARRGFSAKELMKKGVMRAKKGQWNKMLEEIPLKERIKTIIQPLLDSGDIEENSKEEGERYYMKRLGGYAPFYSQQVLRRYERDGTHGNRVEEDLTDTGYKREKRMSLFSLMPKAIVRGEPEFREGRRGEVSFPKFKALHPEIFKKLNELFGNASTRELRKLAVNMPSAPTKNDMINEVINFVVFGKSRMRLTYGFKPGEGGWDTEGTEGRYGWGERNEYFGSGRSGDTRYSGLRTLGEGVRKQIANSTQKTIYRASRSKTRTIIPISSDDEPIEEVESAPESDDDDEERYEEEESDNQWAAYDEESDQSDY
tara:strand:+ start:1678 stop:2913 length:1236 start_codon:yes stop_codon:yes gene_type:complete